MIQLIETNEIIGSIGISPPEAVPDLAIWIFKPYRKKGYGTSAFALATMYAIDVLKIVELHAGAYPDNIGSRKMLHKCRYVPFPKGNIHESITYPERTLFNWILFTRKRRNENARNRLSLWLHAILENFRPPSAV